MDLYEKPAGVQSRWISFESTTLERGRAGLENKGAKGHPFEPIPAGSSKTLLDVKGSGVIRRIWLTVADRSPAMLRSLKLEIFWDDATTPAVSVPLGDFFGIGLGQKLPFECALFSDPEGRSFNCFVPMPFRSAARITLTNESETDLAHLFYDIDLLTDVRHSEEVLYFHAYWRREAPNKLGEEFEILPQVQGSGRFLGCNLGVIIDLRYSGTWWGEGEVKIRFGGEENPTLCGTGTEDYIGTGWGQGFYIHRTQGCSVAGDPVGYWAFYRYHLDDPVYFDGGCQVSIQTMGGASLKRVLELQDASIPCIPVSIDNAEKGFVRLMDAMPAHDLRKEFAPERWCNFWRQDDWSGTAYFYLNEPENGLAPIGAADERRAGLKAKEETKTNS